MVEPQVRTFGNTVANQSGNIWLWTVFSAVLFTLFVVFSEREPSDIGKAFLIAAFPATFFAITFLFRLQFSADTVSHYFLGRFLLSSKPVADLRRVDIGRGVAATLRFVDGSSIRLLGADIRLLRDMCQFIDEHWPNQVEIRWNGALLALVALDRK